MGNPVYQTPATWRGGDQYCNGTFTVPSVFSSYLIVPDQQLGYLYPLATPQYRQGERVERDTANMLPLVYLGEAGSATNGIVAAVVPSGAALKIRRDKLRTWNGRTLEWARRPPPAKA